MPVRAYLIAALVFSLLLSPQAPAAMAQSAEARAPGCAMAVCTSGCCAQMACCVHSAQDQRQPERTPAPPRMNLELAALGLRSFFVLYVLPTVEGRLVPCQEAETAHTLPRLAATCIRLI